MISPLPGAVPLKPGSATLPLPGIIPDIVDANGSLCANNREGYLIIRHPWPSMVAHNLGRSRAIQRAVLVAGAGRLLHRRCGAAR